MKSILTERSRLLLRVSPTCTIHPPYSLRMKSKFSVPLPLVSIPKPDAQVGLWLMEWFLHSTSFSHFKGISQHLPLICPRCSFVCGKKYGLECQADVHLNLMYHLFQQKKLICVLLFDIFDSEYTSAQAHLILISRDHITHNIGSLAVRWLVSSVPQRSRFFLVFPVTGREVGTSLRRALLRGLRID